MPNENVRVRGVKELAAQFRGLPDKLQKRVINSAMLDGAKIIRDSIKAYAPHGATGALIANVVAKAGARQYAHGLDARYIIGIRHGKTRTEATRYKTRGGKTRKRGLSKYDKAGNDPYYYRFQELGYHAVGSIGQAPRAGGVDRLQNARFIPGRHFMRQGIDAATSRATDVVIRSISANLDKLS